MITKYIVSVKSTGISYNIIKLILLTDLAKRYNRQLIFLTDTSHIPILKKFNNDCIYLTCVSGHTDKFNSYNRKRQIQSIYELNYKKFLKSTYIDNITTGIDMQDIKYIFGCIFDIVDSKHDVLLIDYGKNIKNTVKALHSIPSDRFNIDVSHHKYNSNILTINVIINEPDNSRIYELWDEIIPALKHRYNMPILLISGNNDIKKYLGDKHNCQYEIKETEVVYSLKRNSNTIKGVPRHAYDDLVICKSTHFIPFIKLKEDYPSIISKYNDIKFVTKVNAVGGPFDILAHYLSVATPAL